MANFTAGFLEDIGIPKSKLEGVGEQGWDRGEKSGDGGLPQYSFPNLSLLVIANFTADCLVDRE